MGATGSQEQTEKRKYRDIGEVGQAVKEAITLPPVVRWVRNTIAIAIWTLLFTHIFVIDLSEPAVRAIPGLGPVIRFRFLVLLALVAVLLLTFRNRYVFLFAGYIAFFPIVVVVWVLPRAVFRNWVVVLAFWPAIHTFISTFRVSFALWVAAVVSCVGIMLFADPLFIALCMGVLGLYFLTHYGRRIHAAFSSKTGFAALTPMVQGFWRSTADQERGPIDAEPDSDEYRRRLGQRLMNLYLTATLLYVVGEKLRAVIRTKKLDLYLVCSFIYTFLVTIAFFSFQYLGIHRLEPDHFMTATDAGLLDFVGYSLSTALNAGISPIVPATLLAQMLSYVEVVFMLLIAVLFVFVLFTSARERHRQDLDEVVSEIGGVSDRMGTFLLEHHDLTVAAADQYLLQVNPLLARWALKIMYGEERAKKIPGFVDEEPEHVSAPALERPAVDQDPRDA